jgi:hypothetical protein
MQPSKQTDSRKKFLIWGAAILSSLTILNLLPGKKTRQAVNAGDKVKMLSPDGRLVEIDKRLLSSSKRKVTDEELKSWIRK